MLGEGVKQQILQGMAARVDIEAKKLGWRRGDQSQMGCMNVFLAALAPGWKVVFISLSASMLTWSFPQIRVFHEFSLHIFCSAVLFRSLPQLCNQNHIAHFLKLECMKPK